VCSLALPNVTKRGTEHARECSIKIGAQDLQACGFLMHFIFATCSIHF
jgi:hypothetical protein